MLNIIKIYGINLSRDSAEVACLAHNQKVEGSIPSPATISPCKVSGWGLELENLWSALLVFFLTSTQACVKLIK